MKMTTLGSNRIFNHPHHHLSPHSHSHLALASSLSAILISTISPLRHRFHTSSSPFCSSSTTTTSTLSYPRHIFRQRVASFHSSQYRRQQQKDFFRRDKRYPFFFIIKIREARESFGRAREALFDTKAIWRPIPISLGLAVIAFLHLRRNKDKAPSDPDLVVEGPLQIRMYAALPLREVSRIWGWVNSLTVPPFLRGPLYKTYSYAFGCNLDEMADKDLASYPNLGEFFYRTLQYGARPVDKTSPLARPDGKVLAFGAIHNRQIEHVKGVTYSVDALLGKDGLQYKTIESSPASPNTSPPLLLHPEADPAAKSAPSEGNVLHYCVIYLAPGDYHRFHSPTDWTVNTMRHFAGELLSVSPMIVSKIRNLFVLNERVTLTGTWTHGIQIDLDPELKTNLPEDLSPQPLGTFIEKRLGGKGRTLYRGQEVGGFRLGSTIVLVFEAPNDFKFLFEEGQKVRMGQRLGF
ncbi:phosphatidylserine decarboxylase-domain-containing protein [Chytridium lagenaria]|nr:phosphatidylserine decarboxylase-domain-containing protein [Chytridium lagenaria]